MDEVAPQKKAYKKPVFWAAASLLLVLFVLGAFLTVNLQKNSVPQPSQQELQSLTNNLPLYYPTKLPAGYAVNASSISTTSDVTTYQITKPNTEAVVVSIQAVPQTGFSFVQFYNETIKGQEFENQLGESYLGSLDEKSVASIKTEDAWILISAPGSTDASDLKDISNALRNVR